MGLDPARPKQKKIVFILKIEKYLNISSTFKFYYCLCSYILFFTWLSTWSKSEFYELKEKKKCKNATVAIVDNTVRGERPVVFVSKFLQKLVEIKFTLTIDINYRGVQKNLASQFHNTNL